MVYLPRKFQTQSYLQSIQNISSWLTNLNLFTKKIQYIQSQLFTFHLTFELDRESLIFCTVGYDRESTAVVDGFASPARAPPPSRAAASGGTLGTAGGFGRSALWGASACRSAWWSSAAAARSHTRCRLVLGWSYNTSFGSSPNDMSPAAWGRSAKLAQHTLNQCVHTTGIECA